GNIFYGPDGYVVCPSYNSGVAYSASGEILKRFSGGGDHYDNFVQAVRKRLGGDFQAAVKHLNADILEGHLSSALCHTGNISYRMGKSHPAEEIRDTIKSNKDLSEAFGRMEEHLAANKVDLGKTPATLGLGLNMDPKTEKFIGNPAADQLLTREYRKPFVVPEKV